MIIPLKGVFSSIFETSFVDLAFGTKLVAFVYDCYIWLVVCVACSFKCKYLYG